MTLASWSQVRWQLTAQSAQLRWLLLSIEYRGRVEVPPRFCLSAFQYREKKLKVAAECTGCSQPGGWGLRSSPACAPACTGSGPAVGRVGCSTREGCPASKAFCLCNVPEKKPGAPYIDICYIDIYYIDIYYIFIHIYLSKLRWSSPGSAPSAVVRSSITFPRAKSCTCSINNTLDFGFANSCCTGFLFPENDEPAPPLCLYRMSTPCYNSPCRDNKL